MKQKGFTLIELIIVMGVTTILLVMMTDVFASLAKVRTESEATSAVAQDGRFILARLEYDILRASSVTTPAALGASSGTLVLVIGGVSNAYSVSGTDFQLVNNLGTNNLNGSETNISAFSAQKIGNSGGKETIKLSIVVTSKAVQSSGSETKTYTTTVGRR